jgi:predicted transcriptional regulator
LVQGAAHRRTRYDIYASILQAAQGNGLTMTQAIFHLNLNSRLARASIDHLLRSGLLEVHRRSNLVTYLTTTKGAEWLRRYVSLIRELESYPIIQADAFVAA